MEEKNLLGNKRLRSISQKRKFKRSLIPKRTIDNVFDKYNMDIFKEVRS